MHQSRHHLMFASAMTLVLAVGVARAQEGATVPTNPGFNPSTGQINPGGQAQAPSASTHVIRIPTPEEARAAFLEPVSTQPSLGSDNNSSNQQGEAIDGKTVPAATSGSGGVNDMQNTAQPAPQKTMRSAQGATANEPPPSGPIGAIGQTMPAKFSKRNDILDRVPIMAFPLGLSDEDRRKIYQAVMADKAPAAAGADALMPASQLSTDQALNGMHPLPEILSGIVQVQRYNYVKAKDKVLLVVPSTRVVVDQIKS